MLCTEGNNLCRNTVIQPMRCTHSRGHPPHRHRSSRTSRRTSRRTSSRSRSSSSRAEKEEKAQQLRTWTCCSASREVMHAGCTGAVCSIACSTGSRLWTSWAVVQDEDLDVGPRTTKASPRHHVHCMGHGRLYNNRRKEGSLRELCQYQKYWSYDLHEWWLWL